MEADNAQSRVAISSIQYRSQSIEKSSDSKDYKKVNGNSHLLSIDSLNHEVSTMYFLGTNENDYLPNLGFHQLYEQEQSVRSGLQKDLESARKETEHLRELLAEKEELVLEVRTG